MFLSQARVAAFVSLGVLLFSSNNEHRLSSQRGVAARNLGPCRALRVVGYLRALELLSILNSHALELFTKNGCVIDRAAGS